MSGKFGARVIAVRPSLYGRTNVFRVWFITDAGGEEQSMQVHADDELAAFQYAANYLRKAGYEL